ncbi:glyoxylase-like metal-dependent hydrolase (beta-lactamase superfamily II) [Arcticibacter pallidicorallinus]|uniref:Glyoxylase-like metal-dependent hydrolase (Beta-lactamase superfamily II) n=1 Tax=Arcticibacter pallidicorallinus TaxID=1259464 RepID=A0A2T0U7L7_9SPHI|nr:MBL fold metallo-hydrolase [Arcticibacter pallidicorallinus]PRY53899.1 glyoxylase-like metal-dependent hydrolase (beta-lactamase superfamily II) [Arcticibacter pallidicorallinus]
MIQVKSFVCNPFQENTYLLYDETGQCVIIDPGMYTGAEQNTVTQFISENKLSPTLLLNTHCHIDHVLGNKFVFDSYGLLPQFHEGELPVITSVPAYSAGMGIQYDVSPLPVSFLGETGTISFGNSSLEIIFAPGHSPAHICFYSAEDSILIGGDVLFYRSIGRTDLPGGNHNQLLRSIRENIFALPDSCKVYPGHGPETTIGFEKQFNPFLN